MHPAGKTRDEERDRAFRDYVLPELDVLYGVAMRLTRNPHDAEDLVQETIYRAYRALDRFDGRYPRAWLLTILRNTNINRIRKKKPDLLYDEERTFGSLAAAGADGREGPAETALERIPDDEVVEAVKALSDDHRAVVALVDIDGLTYREAAEVLDVPIGTVMSRLHRARKKLRSRLERVGYLEEGDR
ncbi:MAG: sigma-70 family RNA polymerase sigma factor [Nitriliruptorales bacterium]|nr:sigma-70 family RNA polymerase sigma factor [Nitriliruptorales bacterium]